MPTNPLVFVFTSLFFFAFRESTKTATVWRAFHGRSIHELRTKGAVSVFLLIVLPLAAFSYGVIIIRNLSFDAGSWRFVRECTFVLITIFLAGLFPRACKNLWALVTQVHDRQGKSRCSWIWELNRLPHHLYSLQVLIVLGVVPIILMLLLVSPARNYAPRLEDFQTLWIAVYSAQLVVLFHIAKERRFLYREEHPKCLINRRLLVTISLIIFLPMAFGIACLAWMAMPLSWRTIPLIVGLGFPYCCSSALFLLARKCGWGNDDPESELQKGLPDWYFLCFCFVGVMCFAAMTVLSLANTETMKALRTENAKWLLYLHHPEAH